MPWLLLVPAVLAVWLVFTVWAGLALARTERERRAADRRLLTELAKHPTETGHTT